MYGSDKIKLCTYANELFEIEEFLQLTECKQKLYLCYAELGERELLRHLNSLLILNWIVRNRTILTFKVLIYVKLNYFE